MITRRRFMKNETSLNYIKLFPVDYYDDRLDPTAYDIDTFLCEEVRDAYKDILYDNEEESITILLPSNFTILTPFLEPYVEDGEQIWPHDLFEKIELSEGFTEISEGAIDNWAYLHTIIVPSTITSINCDNYRIKHVYINNLETWCNIDFNEKPNPASNGGHLYLNNIEITNLEIPESIDTISPYAFYGITHITSLSILGTNTQFDENTFKNCEGITQIDSYSSIPNSGFYSSVNLEKIILHDSVTTIGEMAFYGCRSLTNVEIPDGVISIGSVAFANCSSLTSITIPDSVTTIGDHAFYNCKNLYKVISRSLYPTWNLSSDGLYFQNTREGFKIYIPVNCKNVYINNNPYFSEHSDWIIEGFNGDTQLCPYNDQIWLSENSSSSGYRTRQLNEPLLSINYEFMNWYKDCIKIWLPDSITTISEDAFSGYQNMTHITIGGGVTNMGARAFSGCYELQEVVIRDGATNIGQHAFYQCSKLTSVTIGNGVITIGSNAFEGCSSLTSITIPNSVTSIGAGAFAGCSKLSSINIPINVTTIENDTFNGCSNLSKISFGSSITLSRLSSIGKAAFKGCSLTTFTIPLSVKTIGYEAFANCAQLTTVICNATVVPTAVLNDDGEWKAFEATSADLTIKVPSAAILQYRQAQGWSEYYSKIIKKY